MRFESEGNYKRARVQSHTVLFESNQSKGFPLVHGAVYVEVFCFDLESVKLFGVENGSQDLLNLVIELAPGAGEEHATITTVVGQLDFEDGLLELDQSHIICGKLTA